MSKERPIIMTGESVRAILNGRKTQTRRVIKFRLWADSPVESMTEHFEPFSDSPKNEQFWSADHKTKEKMLVEQKLQCPYGVVGDRLWVRETWDFRPMKGECASNRIVIIGYKADDATKAVSVPPDCNPTVHQKWRSPIHMYKWVARLWLEIIGIRVERVQEISEDDAKAEGVSKAHLDDLGQTWKTYKRGFESLWDSINAKRGYGWDKNNWVWVIEFRKVKDGE